MSIVLINCSKNKEQINYVVFSGIVVNPIVDSLQLLNKNHKPIKTIYLSADNSFKDTLFIPNGYYFLGDWNTTKQLYLRHSFNLVAKIVYHEKEATLSFKGIGANENNYLYQKKEFDTNFINYRDYLSLNEEDFLKVSDSIYTTKTNFFKTYKNLDKDFNFCESFVLENDRVKLLNRYRQGRGSFIGNNDFQVSDNFSYNFNNSFLSNEKLLMHPNYLNYVGSFVGFKLYKNKYEWNNTLASFEIIDTEINNQKIKDELAYTTMKFAINRTKNLDEVYSKYMSIEKNEEYRNEIEETYLNLKKLSKGAISPTFELYDINDKLVRLKDLKGKLVYIDIWATWCIPCVQEMPALKELEKEFRNKEIYLVSICYGDTKERFRKMVKEKELGGLQLFSPDNDIPFFKEYILRGIPRFILIDKEGKIIDANAYKPSDPKLKELILEELN
ncbi:TlpA disulfide reductase family protein [uncultured Lutibacter sp.]|uniref:TlpA family protein disulfide reductase n=1 Tax=uncultured Lutibacter sp. TaxID=437739 RepID=UPI002621C474|nr:TlpA disulfide reductase family protein [uncultured Lutibacter sp.]